MNGLRVYINPKGPCAIDRCEEFYSRRDDGPYYVWRYAEELERWCASRVHPSQLSPKVLCIANWKAVPSALQARLGEHYLD
jgi:hypothetical protein